MALNRLLLRSALDQVSLESGPPLEEEKNGESLQKNGGSQTLNDSWSTDATSLICPEPLAELMLASPQGALPKLIMPGDDPGEAAMTLIIGVVGAVIGGFIAVQLGYDDIAGFGFRSFVIAIIGVLVLLGGYQLLRRS